MPALRRGAASCRRLKRPKTRRSTGCASRPSAATPAKGLCRPAGRVPRKNRAACQVTRHDPGLANLHRLTGSPDLVNTPRMGKKPGPKTSRNIYLQSHGTSARKGRRTGAGRRHSYSKQVMPPPFRRVTSFRLGQSRALQARRPSAFGRLERPPSKAGDRLCISSNDLNHTAPAAPTNPPQDDSSCTATTHVNSYIAPATAP